MDSWIIWNLTGGPGTGPGTSGMHVTDVTNASRTMLMNLETLDWDADLLAAFGIPLAMLPEIRPSIGRLGSTADPLPGIPIGAVIGDQQASLFGQTAFDAGEAKCTFGTGSFLLLNTGTEIVRSRHGLITTVAHKVAGEPAVYALEGSVAVAGGLVQWCRDNLGLIRSPAEIETLAAGVPDNGGCYLVPAFSGLFAPHWDNTAQGILVGLTSYVTKAHIARAVLEATAWQTRDVVDAMNADAGVPALSLAVDGGMTGDNLLMQLVADALDIPVVRPMMAETVALGAAYAAGLAVGYWPDRQVLATALAARRGMAPTDGPGTAGGGAGELASCGGAGACLGQSPELIDGNRPSDIDRRRITDGTCGAVGRNRTSRIAQARLPCAQGAPSVGSRTTIASRAGHFVQHRPIRFVPANFVPAGADRSG